MGPGAPPASIHLRWLWCARTVLRCAGVLTPEIVSRAGAGAFAGAGAGAGAINVHVQECVQV